MAARSDAAAHGSLFWLCTVCFLFVCVNTLEQATYIYSRMDLFDIGMSCRSDITADFHRTNNIPEDIARPPGSPWIVFGPVKQRRRRRERKQKRGCHAGLLARLRKRPHRPPLPSLFLANARSIVHKMEELEVLLAANTNVRDCCVMIITESWLHSRIPDAAVQLPGRSTHRYDRNSASGKSRGGGLCVYIHNDWCMDSRVTHTHCSPYLEVMSIMCRPFYLPRELTGVIINTVYIPPDANASIALDHLQSLINKQQRSHPDGVHIVAGDFNHACLKNVLPKFVQYVRCTTRGKNTLDRVYSNLKHAYRAVPLPHLGLSDHLSLLLIPAYTPLRSKTKPVVKYIRTWPEGALSLLQDCFEHTVWDIFEQSNLEEHTEAVLSYIKFCTDTVTVEKRIRVYPNQKPWMTTAVRSLLNSRDTAFRSGDAAQYSMARANLRRGIKAAKEDYKGKVEVNLAHNKHVETLKANSAR
ncbi:Proteinase R [Dissostichus eleginoides]|uniref:Proteinase R n=1 Tax=Dissostichus eleginoides TaxID=100907 RepID=A0AAD9FK11_DISEL|nr:Proteinase R [Dissostichus eleginoides]